MKSQTARFVLGVALTAAAAVLLARDPACASVEGAVVDASGSIGLAVAMVWGLITLALVGGIMLLRRA